MGWKESARREAAKAAVGQVESGMVVGLGSGSTVEYAIKELGRRVREENLQVLGVPTSYQSLQLALEEKIPLTTLDEHPILDLAIDGADEVDPDLNLIKGLGGALTREKIVDTAAKLFIVIVDEDKLVERLGMSHPVPLEVLPFALAPVKLNLQKLGGKPILRMAEKKAGPVITDNGNFILDVDFGPIQNPKELDKELHQIPGVVETGLFLEVTDTVYVGGREGVRKLEKTKKY